MTFRFNKFFKKLKIKVTLNFEIGKYPKQIYEPKSYINYDGKIEHL